MFDIRKKIVYYNIEKGAGTMNPSTFLRVLGPEPWRVAYVEPSRRPADGRYGDNPNRLFQHHQFQVIVKPSPENIQELYLQSLAELGIHQEEHDIRFIVFPPHKFDTLSFYYISGSKTKHPPFYFYQFFIFIFRPEFGRKPKNKSLKKQGISTIFLAFFVRLW